MDIINPRVILCLGKTVFDGVRLAAGQEYNYKGKKYYNDVIGTGAEVVDFKGKSIYVVPLAHSGNYGNLNRNERKKQTRVQDMLSRFKTGKLGIN